MESALQKKIKSYMEAKSISATSLEREAGLKTNAVRNILRGSSKKPTGVTLQAIAHVMGCTVEELLGNQGERHKPRLKPSSEKPLSLDCPEILNNSLQSILKIIKNNNYSLTVPQALFVLEEVYAYSIEKKPPKIDEDFVEWYIKKVID